MAHSSDPSEESPAVIREILGTADPAFRPAMALYEKSFPPEERVPVSTYEGVVDPLAKHRRGQEMRDHLLVAEREGKVVAMRHCNFDPKTGLGFFIYLAVDPEYRRHGLGQRMIEFSQQLCRLDAIGTGTRLRAILFECEMVRLAKDEADRKVREARLAFFKNRGARVVTNTYTQPAISASLAPVPLNLMAYVFEEPFDRAQAVLDFYTRFMGVGEGSEMVARALTGVDAAGPS